MSVTSLNVWVGNKDSYPPVSIVVLSFLVEISIRPLPMDHAAAHRDGSAHDMINQLWLTSMAHGIDAALRKGQIDGFGEIERCC